MKIDFANLNKAYQKDKISIDKAISSVIEKSSFIMGKEVIDFEEKLKKFCGSKFAVSCSNGTDALLLALMSINIQPGDEVITTPFTFISTSETISFFFVLPVFVDIDEKTFNINVENIEAKISNKTKAIIPVSLFGQMSDMKTINDIARRNNLIVIEDAAQSFGATSNSINSCNSSILATTSFFPAKPLGCFGDGGAVFTNDIKLFEKIKSLRIHGQTKKYHHQYIGMGGRLDTLQAAILNVKIDDYQNDIIKRQAVAEIYTSLLKNSKLETPLILENNTSVWAQYCIRVKNRDSLQEKLKNVGVPTAVHYPKPLHLQECFSYLGYKSGDFPISETVSKEIMSLPINPYIKFKEQNFIIDQLKNLI